MVFDLTDEIASLNLQNDAAKLKSILDDINANLKNNVVVNVKDFGAKGDGVTDDTVAINNAIAAANAQGGGIVLLPYTEFGYNYTYSMPPKGVIIIIEGQKDGVPRERFGGNPQQRFQQGELAYLDGPHTDHRKVLKYRRVIAEGSTVNGPNRSDIINENHLEKLNWLTTTVPGEGVVNYNFLRWGGATSGEKSDSMIYLSDVVARDGAGFHGLGEHAISTVDASGNTIRRIVIQDGVLNSRDGDHFGKLIDAVIGINDYGIKVREKFGSNTGEWVSAFQTESAGVVTADISMNGTIYGLNRIGAGLNNPQAKFHALNTSAGAGTVGMILSNASTTNNTSTRLVFNLSTSLSTESCFIEGVRTNSPVSSAALLNFRTSDGAANHEVKISEQGVVILENTITPAGTTGNRTINNPSGSVNIAAGQGSITVTNNTVKSTSLVFAVIATNDATAVLKNVVVSSGSFVINLNAAATAETRINWFVLN